MIYCMACIVITNYRPIWYSRVSLKIGTEGYGWQGGLYLISSISVCTVSLRICLLSGTTNQKILPVLWQENREDCCCCCCCWWLRTAFREFWSWSILEQQEQEESNSIRKTPIIERLNFLFMLDNALPRIDHIRSRANQWYRGCGRNLHLSGLAYIQYHEYKRARDQASSKTSFAHQYLIIPSQE